MALSITKTELKDLEPFVSALKEARIAMESAIFRFNDALEPVRAWRDAVVYRLDEEVGERSERWQESEAASEVASWLDELRDIDLDEAEENVSRADEAMSELRHSPQG